MFAKHSYVQNDVSLSEKKGYSNTISYSRNVILLWV